MKGSPESSRKVTKEESIPGTYKIIESRWYRGSPYIFYSESRRIFYSDGTSEVVIKKGKVHSPTSRWITSQLPSKK